MNKGGKYKKVFNILFIFLVCLVAVLIGSIISTKMINDDMSAEEKIKAEQLKKEEEQKQAEQKQERIKAEIKKQTEQKRQAELEKQEKVNTILKLKEMQEKRIKADKMKKMRTFLIYKKENSKLFYFFIGYSNKKFLIIKEKNDIFIIDFQDIDGFEFPLTMRETFKTKIEKLNTKNNKEFDIFTAMFLSEKSKATIYGEQFVNDLELKRIGNAYVTTSINFSYNINKFIYIPKTVGIYEKPTIHLYSILESIVNEKKEDVFMANFTYNEKIFLNKWFQLIKENKTGQNFYYIKINSKKLNNIVIAQKLLNNGFTNEEIQNHYFLKVLNGYYRKRLTQILDFYGKYDIKEIDSFDPYKEVDIFAELIVEDEKKNEERLLEIEQKKQKLDNLLSRIIRLKE